VKLMREGKGSVDFEEVMHLLGHSSLAVTQIYAATVLDDPKDKGAKGAVEALLPTQKRKRLAKPPKADQMPLEGASIESALAEIRRLQAEVERLKARS